MQHKGMHMAAFFLVAIGAVNWGLVGLFDLDLVATILSFSPGLQKLVYVLVGLSGVYLFMTHKDYCKYCSDGKKK